MNGLTVRELEVLEMLAKGFPDEVIADKLSISPRTAQVHASRIYRKLGVHSRTQAALFYHGLMRQT